ncbi:Glycine cleavage system H protein 2, mitochondrial [Ananas comosus]|uniref:Glycine cleavage system H protein 2, mitochondrial n=1 Tax=Ananas comosus TaxID=4615 RepID=A0A199V3D4_ANACO|nr:Glycine cleavage system H protein 2, mitochondrial [Ananas comosus]
MASSRLLWASRAASYLRISPLCRGFSTVLQELKYADSHEWVKVDGDSATVGITDHAQINASPYDSGWIIKVKISGAGELTSLMDSDKYAKFCEEENAKH